MTASLQQVCAVQRGCAHPHTNFVFLGNRFRDLSNFEHLRSAETCNDNCLHLLSVHAVVINDKTRFRGMTKSVTVLRWAEGLCFWDSSFFLGSFP